MKSYKIIDGLYVENGEEHLIRHILPGRYIEESIDKDASEDYAIRFLQNELNAILNSFVNGGFSYKGYLLYPLIRDVSAENSRKLLRLKGVAIFLNKRGYDFSGSVRAFKNNAGSRNFALILSSLYRDFSIVKNKKRTLAKKPECQELDLSSYNKNDLEYLKPLEDLKDYANSSLKKYLSGFYLHGSFATKDYVKGWSDVDTLAVVSKETIENPKKLLELRDRMYVMRRFFYRMEPLQHHGSIIISEHDLNSYCQSYFPVPVFKYAKSFFKDDKIKSFKVRDYSREAFARLLWFVSYFRKMKAGKRLSLGSYETKNLLHCITLFPAIYLNAKGILVYKKFSFGMAKKDFSKEEWKVVDYAGKIRKNWKSGCKIPLIGKFSGINPLLFYQINSRAADLFRNINKLNNIDTGYLAENMFRLSEKAWSSAKKNAKGWL